MHTYAHRFLFVICLFPVPVCHLHLKAFSQLHCNQLLQSYKTMSKLTEPPNHFNIMKCTFPFCCLYDNDKAVSRGGVG